MKKYFVLLLVTAIMLFEVLGVQADIGDVVTYTKYTDIYAYINNYIIPSYNIDGYTGVVAENLRYYGFDVFWNEEERTLNVERNSISEITEYIPPTEVSISELGKNAYAVLETDIKTYISGVAVKSYNIGGQTVIVFDSLSVYGEVHWDESSRKIKLWIDDGLSVSDYETQPLSGEALYSTGEYGYEEDYSNHSNTGGSSVFRTPYGKRYHFDPDCGGKNSYKTTMMNAKSAGLTPCKKCAY